MEQGIDLLGDIVRELQCNRGMGTQESSDHGQSWDCTI